MSENVKICCSSRPHQVFQDAFSARPGLKLEDLTFPDIRKFVNDKLGSTDRWKELQVEEPEATIDLINEIVTSASGVFLWVRLVVASLLSGLGNRDDVSVLQIRLRRLPPELDDLYSHMIFKIDEVYLEETSRLFQIMTCASQEQSKPSNWGGSEGLSILALSFAAEITPTLVVATQANLTADQVQARCKKMDIKLRTRSGGLLEVPHRRHLQPEMKVLYLHRTVKDYLELTDTRHKLSRITSSDKDHSFEPNTVMVHAYVSMLQALHATCVKGGVVPWGLINGAIHHARRAELQTKKGQPELMDQFYQVASSLWSLGPFSIAQTFFKPQKSMMTLAAQCGLWYYLDFKLSKHNTVNTEPVDRSLLDWALVTIKSFEHYVSPGVVRTLVHFGAMPNEPSIGLSVWEKLLLFLNTHVMEMPSGEQKELALLNYAAIITVLLEAGANPRASSSGPPRQSTRIVRHRTVLTEYPWSLEEIISRLYERPRPLLATLATARAKKKPTASKDLIKSQCRTQ